MGLVPAIVDIPERWRPWLDSGLTHFLGPLPWLERLGWEQGNGNLEFSGGGNELPFSDSIGSGVSRQRPLAKPLPSVKSGLSTAETTNSRALALNKPGFSKKTTSGVGGEQLTPAGQPVEAPQRPLPTPAWPEAWKSAWSKTGFARPFLWTYEQLGEDLLGTPAPERREMLRRLLAALNFGPVHNFWPFSEPDGQGGLRLQAELFQEGLTYLAPKCVIFFGDKEIAGITAPGVPELFKVISYRDAGVLCVHIPDIHDLALQPALLDDVTVLFRRKLANLI